MCVFDFFFFSVCVYLKNLKKQNYKYLGSIHVRHCTYLLLLKGSRLVLYSEDEHVDYSWQNLTGPTPSMC